MKKNPFAITFDDFVFYVIYTHERGYNLGTSKAVIQSRASSELDVETVPGHKFYQTEWRPITSEEGQEYGTALVKYCGMVTFKGVKDLIWNNNLSQTYDTSGSLTIEYGHLPATSFSTEWVTESYYNNYSYDDIVRRLKGKCSEMTYCLQSQSQTECYISAMVLTERINEVIFNVFHKSLEQLTEEEKSIVLENMNSVYDMEYRVMEWLRDYAIGNEDEEFNFSDFAVDFRERALPFEEVV